MKNNYLLLVTNKTIVSKLKGESNITFLFPVTGFSVGFPTTFSLKEIPAHGYIFMNRILDHQGIEDFKKLLECLPDHIEGIVFDDIGVLEVLNTTSNHLEKILFLNHFNCNYISIQAYLDYVDSIIVSTDITEDEVREILGHVKKPLVLYTFGHVNIMYSRRLLVTNYNEHFHKQASLVSELTNDLKQKFKIVENEYGTVIYTSEPFNGLRYRKYENVKYHFVNTIFLSDDEVLEILHSDTDLESKYPYQYLSRDETIVRIKER